MASAFRKGRDEGGAQRCLYVASMIWPARLPLAANDNPAPLWLKLHRAVPLVASAALLAAAIWAVAG